jgi:electron transfer flavoprotein alpha subunit
VNARIFAYIVHRHGIVDDSAAELLAAAKQIDPQAPLVALVAGYGADLDRACAAVPGGFAEVWKIGHELLAYPNAELIRQALVTIVPREIMILVPHDHFGIDLAPGLAVKMEAAFVADVTAIAGREGSKLTLVRQEFGGQVSTHILCDSSLGAVLSIRPGAFRGSAGGAAAGTVIDKSSSIGVLIARRRHIHTVSADAGDVDITKPNLLVSVGRGIQEKDNIVIAQELADALGGAVSCSRPVVDAKWLEKSRQVGSSGKTVKPKIYLACGISGAFQHLAGIKGSPFIIAINKNPQAPIFQVADVGVVDDVLEFLPELTSKAREMRLSAAR